MSREAYADWSRTLRGKEHRAVSIPEPELEPVFVASDLEPGAFFALVDAEPDLFYLPMEPDLVGAYDDAAMPRVEALLLRRPGRGLPAGLRPATYDRPVPQVPQPSRKGGRTGIAIIDDGIGFLNARFRSGPETSRFLGVWLQSAASRLGPAQVGMGRVLGAGELADLTARAARSGEAALYRDLHDGLHADPRLVKTILQAGTHGTHVLDLAAGADPLDPRDPMRTVPLIAVQLPPEAVDDTSGTGIEMPLIQGLRWAIWLAARSGLDRLVVNASLGVLAGPKNGRSFLERQMACEIGRAAGQGLSIEIVLPYGNDFQRRQVARLSGTTGGRCGITLRLQPQDGTPSYVEIRDLNAGTAGARPLKVGLEMPDGTAVEAQAPAAGTHRDILWREGLAARLYHLGPGGTHPDAALVLAFAPTLRAGAAPVAPAGAWRILFEDADGQDIVLQVQRDDRAAGYRLSGRQAYFDAPDAWRWNPASRDWTGLGNGPIRHDGTNNAFATSRHPAIHSVASARVPPGDAPRPARYASQGAGWSGGAPELSAEAEIASSRPGIIASGTLSGSTARFSGSSAAAPSQTRALAMQAFGRAGTTLEPVRDNDRLGRVVLIGNPAIRKR